MKSCRSEFVFFRSGLDFSPFAFHLSPFTLNNSPIGIYDSGLGGLTVWREVRRALPGESLVYLGDGKNCPYGWG